MQQTAAPSATKQFNIYLDYDLIPKSSISSFIVPLIPNVIHITYNGRNTGAFECTANLTPSDVGNIVTALVGQLSDDSDRVEVYGDMIGVTSHWGHNSLSPEI